MRLDNMDIEEIRDMYNSMFKEYIEVEKLDLIYNRYLEKYEEMKKAEKNGYEAPYSFGRKYFYLKNILYGWYIEDLFQVLLKKNCNVKNVELTGDDSAHLFIYDKMNKKITIDGKKTTMPDYLITTKNNKKIYIELKTSLTEIFSIKAGNVKQLLKTMGDTSIYSVILMIDLVNNLYEIKDFDFFMNRLPFVNNRMEGQLCYDFPKPQRKFSEIIKEDFSKYIKEDIMRSEEVQKFKCLCIAEKIKDKNIIKNIENKIKLDELCMEFEVREQEYRERVNKITLKYPNIENKEWKDFGDELEKIINKK